MAKKQDRQTAVRHIVNNARRKKQVDKLITPLMLIDYYDQRRGIAAPGQHISYSACIRELNEMMPLIPSKY